METQSECNFTAIYRNSCNSHVTRNLFISSVLGYFNICKQNDFKTSVIPSKLNTKVKKFEITNDPIKLLLEGDNSGERSHGFCYICLLTRRLLNSFCTSSNVTLYGKNRTGKYI